MTLLARKPLVHRISLHPSKSGLGQNPFRMTPVDEVVKIFERKSKMVPKAKCPLFKKEVFGNAKQTLKDCESVTEFKSRIVMNEVYGKPVRLTRHSG